MYNWQNLKFEWCEMCEAGFLRCPECGNNSCNGGAGPDGKGTCKTCYYVHGFEDGLPSDMHPENKKDIEAINDKLLESYKLARPDTAL